MARTAFAWVRLESLSTPAVQMVYHCAACDEEFDSQEELADHSAGVTRDQAYRCCVCWMTFRNRYTHRMHVRRHVGVNPYVCETCGKGFEVKRKLEQHARNQCQSSKYPHRCQVCGKGFLKTQGLGSHMLVHKAKALRPAFAKKSPTVASSPARPVSYMPSPTHYSKWPSGDRIMRPFYHDLILPIKQSPRSDSDRYEIVKPTQVNRRKLHAKPRLYTNDFSQQGNASGDSDAEDIKPPTSPDLLENCLVSGFAQCDPARMSGRKAESPKGYTSTPICRPSKIKKTTTPLEHVINSLRQKVAQTPTDDLNVGDFNNDTSRDSGVQGSTEKPAADENDQDQQEHHDDDSSTAVSGVLVARMPFLDLLSEKDKGQPCADDQNTTETSNNLDTSKESLTEPSDVRDEFSAGEEADDEFEIHISNRVHSGNISYQESEDLQPEPHDTQQEYPVDENNSALADSVMKTSSGQEAESPEKAGLKKCYIVLKDVLTYENGQKYLSCNPSQAAHEKNTESSSMEKVRSTTRKRTSSPQQPADPDQTSDGVSGTGVEDIATRISPTRTGGKRELQLLLEPHVKTRSGTTPLVYLLSKRRGGRKTKLFRAKISNKRPRYFSTDDSQTEEDAVEAVPVQSLRMKVVKQHVAGKSTTETSEDNYGESCSDSGMVSSDKEVSIRLTDFLASRAYNINTRKRQSIMERHTSTDTDFESPDHRFRAPRQTRNTSGNKSYESNEEQSSLSCNKDEFLNSQNEDGTAEDDPGYEASPIPKRITRKLCSELKERRHSESGLHEENVEKEVFTGNSGQNAERKRTRSPERDVENSLPGGTARKKKKVPTATLR